MAYRTVKFKGFTLVELLIVIVVIGILAAITLVAYNGVQAKARDSARSSAVAEIQKGLEAYYAEFGAYPPVNPGTGTNVPSGFSGMWGNSTGYSYSVDTAGKWLSQLTQTPDGSTPLLSKVPVGPVNDNTHYFAYYSAGPGQFAACPDAFYILGVYGYENSGDIPSSSHEVNCTQGTQIADWTTTSNIAVFSNIKGQ